jgi:hypothetical protein
MILKFKRNNVGDYFSRWKNGNNRKVEETYNIAFESNEEKTAEFSKNITNIKN